MTNITALIKMHIPTNITCYIIFCFIFLTSFIITKAFHTLSQYTYPRGPEHDEQNLVYGREDELRSVVVDDYLNLFT